MQYQRSDQFEKHDVEERLNQASSLTEDSDAPLYIVDHCCGIIDRDWAAQRLHCDDFFLKMFAEWCNAHMHIYSGGTDSVVKEVGCSATFPGEPLCTFRLMKVEDVYYGMRHTNPVTAKQTHGMCEHLLGKICQIRKDPYLGPP